MTTQLLSDLKSKVRILHEFEHRGTRYRASLRDNSGAVWVDRYEPTTGKWKIQPPLVDEDAELVIQLAKLAGRIA